MQFIYSKRGSPEIQDHANSSAQAANLGQQTRAHRIQRGHMLELHSPRGHIGAQGLALVNSILPEEKSLLEN